MMIGADHPIQVSPPGHVAKLLQFNAATSALLMKWAHTASTCKADQLCQEQGHMSAKAQLTIQHKRHNQQM